MHKQDEKTSVAWSLSSAYYCMGGRRIFWILESVMRYFDIGGMDSVGGLVFYDTVARPAPPKLSVSLFSSTGGSWCSKKCGVKNGVFNRDAARN